MVRLTGMGGGGWGMDVARLEPLAELVSDSTHHPVECITKEKVLNKPIITANDSVCNSP